MNQKKNRDGLQNGPTGDTTTGVNSLSEITAINPSFMDFIGAGRRGVNDIADASALPPPSEGGHSPVKRSPEEIAKQLQIAEKRRPLLSSHETIERLKQQNFELRLMVYNLNENRGIKDADLEGIKKDLVSELMAQNEELKKKLEERDERDRKVEAEKREIQRNAICQTNLDSMNIDELIKANITLKRQKEQLRQQQLNELHRHQSQQLNEPHRQQSTQQLTEPHGYQSTQHLHDTHRHQPAQQPPQYLPQQQQQRHDKLTQRTVMSQLHYPSVTLPKQQFATNKQLAPDEKELLEELYNIDGTMTTVLDKLRAKSDTQ